MSTRSPAAWMSITLPRREGSESTLQIRRPSLGHVVRPYGQQGLVRLADAVNDFVAACQAAMAEDATARMRDADAFLRQTSWDGTWAQMRRLLDRAILQQAERTRSAGSLAAEA